MSNEQLSETPEVVEENDDDFNAGFEAVAEQVPTETPVLEQKTVENQEPAPVEKTPEPEAPAPKLAKITEDQFQDLLKKAESFDSLKAQQDKVFGKLGGIERVLAQLQAETPEGEAIEVTTEDFEDLAREFPEIAESTLKGLTKVLGKLKGTGGKSTAINQEQIAQLVQERVAPVLESVEERVTSAVETKLLSRAHPDWREVVGVKNPETGEIPDTEFRQWLNKQPEEYQSQIGSTWDADLISGAIDKFKESKKVVDPAPAKNARREILNAAATPKGSGGQPPAPSEDDDFNAGFKKHHSG